MSNSLSADVPTNAPSVTTAPDTSVQPPAPSSGAPSVAPTTPLTSPDAMPPVTASSDATNTVPDATSSASSDPSAGGSGGQAPGEGNGGNGVVPDGVGGASGMPPGEGGSAGTGLPAPADSVTRSESTFEFRHFPIETNPEGVWNGPATPGQQPTSTTFDTIVLENGFLKVTLLPEYGGRILSLVHKPTDRELLYQNPIGTPYLMNEGIFYYDYLVIMGGIFPSFPEPEHGKYWNQPYSFEVVSESAEAITVRMSRQDDLDTPAGIPERYVVGRTDMLVEVDVTLRAGSASLELDTKLTNTRSSEVPQFEFWMVNTMAPGSVPGQTSIPLNTRIVAAMDRVHLLESSWAWFGEAEERVNEEVFVWNNLSYFENWVDQGTAFANPQYGANYSGLINYDADIGLLRVSENVKTPGLKLWTFGRQSLDVDINDSEQWLRPTIEMWYGATPEFWNRGTLAAGEVRQWHETYFQSMGLEEVTAASEYGAVHLARSDSGADVTLSATATLTVPGQVVTAVLRLAGNVISEQELTVPASEAVTVSATVPSSEATAGAVFEIEFVRGESSVLSGQLAL